MYYLLCVYVSPGYKKTREKNTTSSYKLFSYRSPLRRYGLPKSSNGIKFLHINIEPPGIFQFFLISCIPDKTLQIAIQESVVTYLQLQGRSSRDTHDVFYIPLTIN